MPVFVIRDLVAEFGRPFTAPNEDFAKRDFAASVNSDPSSNAIAFSPKDFELYMIGSFDSKSGTLTAQLPEFICRGSDLVG